MERPGLVPPAWWTAASTVTGYLIILVILTIALFVLPYVVFLNL